MATETESPEDAAAAAAYTELENTSWPPKRADVQRIAGAAAGAAAGAGCIAAGSISGGATALASPLCSAIGKILGEYIAGAIYDIFDGFFAEEYVAPQYDHVMYQRTRKAAIRIANLQWGVKTPTNEQILAVTEDFEELGVTGATLAAGRGPTEAERGPWKPFYSEQGLDSYLAALATAEGTLASAIVVRQKLGSGKKTSIGKALLIAGGIGGLLWVVKSRLF
jgi:hypothetical protein